MSHVPLVEAVLTDLGTPASTRDFAGYIVDLSSETWRLHDVTRYASINWARFRDCDSVAVQTLKAYAARLIERASPGYAMNTARHVGAYLIALTEPGAPSCEVDLASLTWYLQRLRTAKRTHQFHFIRGWYEFCADQAVPGFDDDTFLAIREYRARGYKQGVAVLSNDPDEGPLDEFEEIALRRALIRDNGPIQERAALWLALAFGSNSANLALLWEDDFTEKTFEGLPSSFFLAIPRIKKRMKTRTDFKVRYVEEHLAEILRELIEYNKGIQVPAGFARPLFMRAQPRPLALGSELEHFAYHFHAQDITDLIQQCVERLGVLSPRTRGWLKVTTRRLRYLFASKMVRQGISAYELAEMLDHSDIQNVMIYFNVDSRFVERLDEALAKQLGPIVRSFMGEIGDSAAERPTINLISFRDLSGLGECGADYTCRLAVGRSCYTCVKFKARSDAPHAGVLAALVQERAELVAAHNERVAEQLDDTILAVGEVVANVEASIASKATA